MRVRRLPVLAALLLLAACAGTPEQPVVATGRAQGARGAAGRRRCGARTLRAARGGTGLPEWRPRPPRTRRSPSRRPAWRSSTRRCVETALAAERWLVLNPTSEQARRFAGVAALELHRLDAAEQHFAQLLASAYISPAAGFLSLLPVVADHGTPTGRHRVVPPAGRAPSGRRRGPLRARQRRAALRELRARRRECPSRHRDRAVLGPGEAAAGTCARSLPATKRPGSTRRRDLVAGARLRRRHAPRLRADARGDRAGRRGARGAHALRRGRHRGAGRGAQPRRARSRHAATSMRRPGASRTCCRPARSPTKRSTSSARSPIAASDADRALRYYSRVGSGDYALAAQGRAGAHQAEQSGLDAGLTYLEEFARGQPAARARAVVTRARASPSSSTTSAVAGHPRRRPRAVPGFARPAHGARVRVRAHRRTRCRDPRPAPAAARASRATRWCRTPWVTRSPTTATEPRRGATPGRRVARADAGQRGGARQHGLGAVPPGARRRRRCRTWSARSELGDGEAETRPAPRRGAVGAR